MAKDRTRTALRPTIISLAVASCFTASTALANPTGANVVRGTVAIHQAGNLLQITNSPNAIINWQSFSIGANEVTRFIQQSASSAVLNRVTTQNPSTILGALQSNGRVFLINPNGILFGAGAQVDVAGLVASTLNMSDADFLGGRLRFTDGLGKSVVNDGSIATAAGGSVYLIGSGVTNNGIITSPQGEVVLAAGNSVELVSPGTPNLRVEIAAADNEARNLGQIISDAGRIGIYAGLINNSGTIRADSAVSEGGRILLKATKSATLESTSILSAQGQGGGEIKVLADESVQVAGRLDASAPVSGDGGFVETSAATVTFDPSTFISTLAPNGENGTWLLDPSDVTIDSLLWTTIATTLAGGDAIITTLGAQCLPGVCGTITISADSPILNTANKLQLVAHQNIDVNGSVTNSGTGTLAMYAGWSEVSGTLNPTVGFGGNISLNAPITLAGKAVLVAGGSVNQNNSAAVITAGSLLAKSNFGVHLAGATNSVGTLAGDTAFGTFEFRNGPSLIIGSVDSENTGIGTIAGVKSGGSTMVTINVTGGSLTVNNNVLAETGNSNEARITLTALNNIISNNSIIRAQASPGEGDGNAFVTLTAQSGDITLNGSTVEARSLGPGCCGTSRNAAVSMTAGGNMALNSSNVVVTGGVGDGSTFSPAPGGAASATVTAGGGVQLTGSSISVTGGDGGAGISGGAGTNGGNASVAVSAGGGIMVNGGGFGARGGFGPAAGGGSAAVALTGNGIGVNGLVFAQGGGGSGGMDGGAGSVMLNGGAGGIIVQSAGQRALVLVDQTQAVVQPSFTLSNGVVATGGDGSNTGGAAVVALNTTGGISVLGTFVGAAGGDASAGTGGNAMAMLTSGGDITLASGVIANGGLGTTNGMGRIDLIFLNSGSDFVVNGQRGLIFDTVTGSGFMVNNAPAVLNVNLFVTSGGPAFIDPLVAAMNQQVDVLADQLRAGETGEGEDKDKKKLPFCSS